jgi:hypothetical protein
MTGKTHQNYKSEEGASGLTVEIEGSNESCRSFTTKNKHHILAVFDGACCQEEIVGS